VRQDAAFLVLAGVALRIDTIGSAWSWLVVFGLFLFLFLFFTFGGKFAILLRKKSLVGM